MVPRQPRDSQDRDGSMTSDPEQDESGSNSDASESSDPGLEDRIGVDMEQEYHTDPEDASEDLGDDNEEPVDAQLESTTPLLPAELLKPLPSPTTSLQQPVLIPREQMTREQKVAQRSRSRKAKKRVWDRLRRSSDASGVLEAGKVAQIKRGVVPRKDKVVGGRVAKKQKKGDVKVSGRQQLLEHRKLDVEERRRGLMRPARTAGTKGSKASKAG